MITALSLLAALSSQTDRSECQFDRQAELARDVVAFDQTEGQGWRPLYDNHCFIEAATLLRDWRAENGDSLDLTVPRERSFFRTLVWHEAQMWGFAERNDLALPLFKTTYKAEASGRAWNLYVDGTLAFLSRDKGKLQISIAELKAVPKPQGWDRAVGADGKPIRRPWPQNLDVLQGLLRCWNEAYSVAYRCRLL